MEALGKPGQILQLFVIGRYEEVLQQLGAHDAVLVADGDGRKRHPAVVDDGEVGGDRVAEVLGHQQADVAEGDAQPDRPEAAPQHPAQRVASSPRVVDAGQVGVRDKLGGGALPHAPERQAGRRGCPGRHGDLSAHPSGGGGVRPLPNVGGEWPEPEPGRSAPTDPAPPPPPRPSDPYPTTCPDE